MKQLVTKLPCEGREPEYPISDDTICAIEATLYEVIKNAAEFASYVVYPSYFRYLYSSSQDQYGFRKIQRALFLCCILNFLCIVYYFDNHACDYKYYS